MSDKYAVPNKLPAKQVSILAHRKRRQIEDKSHKTVKQINRSFKLHKKARGFVRAEFFVNQYRKAERDAKRMRRTIATRTLFRPPANQESQKLLIVYRHRAHKVASQITQKMLNSLRLGVLHNAVFLKNDVQNSALLKLVEPYVTWGYPNINTVRDLIFKHGFLKINGKKVAIDSNKLIEDNLGAQGIICIEDIVHELFTVSENFESIKHLLVPFKLKTPKNGFKNKTGVSVARGGEYGNRFDAINDFIETCL